MRWNYRVIQYVDSVGLHEVHYAADGRIEAHTERPSIVADDVEGLRRVLFMMLADIQRHPVIVADTDDDPIPYTITPAGREHLDGKA